MARGFLSGMIWGGVVSAIGVGALSVIADSPAPPVAEVTAPPATDAPESGTSGNTSAVTDADLVRNGDAPQVRSPQADDVAAAAQAGSDTPVAPETGRVEDLADPARVDDRSGIAVNDVTPVQPVGPVGPPEAPSVDSELSISTEPAQPAPPGLPQTPGAFAAQSSAAPSRPVGEYAAPATSDSVPTPAAPDVADAPLQDDAPAAPDTVDVAPPSERAPARDVADAPVLAEAPAAPREAPAPAQPEVPTSPGAALAPEQTPEAAPQTARNLTLPNALEPASDGRPTIGRPGIVLIDPNPDDPDSSTPVPDQIAGASESARAIEIYAMPFDNPDAKPLMSIVLIDTGVDLSGGPVGLAALQSFPYPLTFAIDARLSDAKSRMADYRARGFEVMALLDLPDGATATDAEVAVAAAFDAVPEAVALIEGTGTGLQNTREASDQIAQALLATGHGLVLQSKGLNTVQKLAAREGVPAGLIFRDFDSADQAPSVIRRFLDQAAFRAAQEGGVIMVGRVRSDTISALLLWGLQDRAERVALAPISAVLTTEAAPGQ